MLNIKVPRAMSSRHSNSCCVSNEIGRMPMLQQRRSFSVQFTLNPKLTYFCQTLKLSIYNLFPKKIQFTTKFSPWTVFCCIWKKNNPQIERKKLLSKYPTHLLNFRQDQSFRSAIFFNSLTHIFYSLVYIFSTRWSRQAIVYELKVLI